MSGVPCMRPPGSVLDSAQNRRAGQGRPAGVGRERGGCSGVLLHPGSYDSGGSYILQVYFGAQQCSADCDSGQQYSVAAESDQDLAGHQLSLPYASVRAMSAESATTRVVCCIAVGGGYY